MDGNRMAQPFGAWLVAQPEHLGWIGELVAAARQDRNFPIGGGPDDVRMYLDTIRAPVALNEAVDDAEEAWRRS